MTGYNTTHDEHDEHEPHPNGTKVRLDDGSVALACYDARDRTYHTAQRNPVTGGTRIDEGWRREQLTVVG